MKNRRDAFGDEFTILAEDVARREDGLQRGQWRAYVTRKQVANILVVCAERPRRDANFWAAIARSVGVEPAWMFERRHPRKGVELVAWVRQMHETMQAEIDAATTL